MFEIIETPVLKDNIIFDVCVHLCVYVGMCVEARSQCLASYSLTSIFFFFFIQGLSPNMELADLASLAG